jgi:putative endonuclease
LGGLLANSPRQLVIPRMIFPAGPRGKWQKIMRISYIYILASKRNGTLYVGVTANLVKRVYEHKAKLIKGFTSEYHVNRLVYFEEFGHISEAIHREKRLKEYPRKWKINLIEGKNPTWRDLYQDIV